MRAVSRAEDLKINDTLSMYMYFIEGCIYKNVYIYTNIQISVIKGLDKKRLVYYHINIHDYVASFYTLVYGEYQLLHVRAFPIIIRVKPREIPSLRIYITTICVYKIVECESVHCDLRLELELEYLKV